MVAAIKGGWKSVTGWGALGALCVGIYSGTSVRRPWTEVPWRLMIGSPELFGGSSAVRTHLFYIALWTLGLVLYAELSVAGVVYGATPAIAWIYTEVGEPLAPRVGPASEIVGGLAAALAVWAMTQRAVHKAHELVPTELLDSSANFVLPATQPPRAELIVRFFVYLVRPFYEHLWQRDGVILSGGAMALQREFTLGTIQGWGLENGGLRHENNGDQECHRMLMVALRKRGLGGYYGVRSVLSGYVQRKSMKNELRRHTRQRVNRRVSVRCTNGQVMEDNGELFDYSLGGVAVMLPSSHPPKKCLCLHINSVPFDMEVVHCSVCPPPSGSTCDGKELSRYLVGLRLMNAQAGHRLCQELGGLASP